MEDHEKRTVKRDGLRYNAPPTFLSLRCGDMTQIKSEPPGPQGSSRSTGRAVRESRQGLRSHLWLYL